MINKPGQFYPGCSTAVGLNVTYRLGKIGEHLQPQGAWLDCGCAEGGYAVALWKAGARQVVGVDRVTERLAVAGAQARSASQALSYASSLSEELSFLGDSFDGVFLNEVLEHVVSEERTLAEIRRVLRPGGHLVVMSPNRFFPFEGHGMQVMGHHMNKPAPLVHWLPRSIGARFMQARNYWPWELRDLVRRGGFEIVAVESAFPTFDVYPWLPARVVRSYQRNLSWLDKVPVLRHLGVSTFILGRKPSPHA